MAQLLGIENLTKSYGDRLLFGDVNFSICEGDKIGIVAKNGTGKTTLLSIIAGREAPDSGAIVARNGLKIAYLEQKPTFTGNPTVVEAALSSHDPVAELVKRYEVACAPDADPAELQEVSHLMDSAGAWDYEDRLKQLLTRLSITDLNAHVDTLSGGQRKKVALAAVLMQNPDIIILDEPTNHLDVEVIEWIENYLKRSRATLLMVTHDRYFLDRVCNRIIEMADKTIYTYDGNYEYYLRRRAERIEAMTAELAKIRNTLRREQEWMSRQPQARAGKARYRIDSFYDLKDRERAGIRPEKDVSLQVKASYIGSKIFEANHVCKAFGNKVILNDFSYTFARYEKVGIIGANGVGKSTFIKMLQGLEPIDSGEWILGTTVRFGYYCQDGLRLDRSKRVIDAVTEIAEEIDMGTHRLSPMQFLNKFLFTPADQQKYIHTLSGGELARLHLATVLMQRPNFLILDEPTNDLDIVTLGILEEYLADFEGCLLVVSHDRYFLDNIVDHLFVMEGDGVVKDFPGTYTEYAAWRDEMALAARSAKPETPREPRHKEKAPKLTYKERLEFEGLEKEIESLTLERKQLEEKFNSGETLTDIAAMSQRYEEIKDLLDEKEMRWLELSEKVS